MTAKPCLGCGTPTPGSRCPDCQPADTRRRDRTHVHSNTARWKALSKKLRKQSPFCEWCGATEALALDHIIPVSVREDLAYTVENCRVLCRSCNSHRGNTFTAEEAHQVLTRLQSAYTRRPTKGGRDRIAAAQQAAQTLGDSPCDLRVPPRGKAQGAMNLTGVKI